MCGIIGYVGGRPCQELIVQGLERLGYRGYDSAGLAFLDAPADGFALVRAVGNLSKLRAASQGLNGASAATTGLGHTRWATHGDASEAQRPPPRRAGQSRSCTTGSSRTTWRCGASSRPRASASFTTRTPRSSRTSIARALSAGRASVEAVRAALRQARGRLRHRGPARGRARGDRRRQQDSPLVIGIGEGEMFLAPRHPRAPRPHPRRSFPRRRRDGRARARRRARLERRRRTGRAG